MKQRRLAIRLSLIALSLPTYLLPPLPAAVPEQFQAWGRVGPEFPSVPAGWREEAPEPESLPVLTPTAEEHRKGCVAFARDPFSEVDASSAPASGERVTKLGCVAESMGKMGEKIPSLFDRRAARAWAQMPPPCSF